MKGNRMNTREMRERKQGIRIRREERRKREKQR
jgi:hypothetical protein